MKSFIKNILKSVRLYYPMQAFYTRIRFSIRAERNRKKYEQFKGSGFTCNICRSMYSKFVPRYPFQEDKAALEKNHVIAGYGENIFCPACMSNARERLVVAFLNDEINFSGKKILHLSPEKNVNMFLKKTATVITADLYPEYYKAVDPKIQKQDATKFTFVDSSFDLVVANHILEHIPEDRKAMREIYRILKPGANAILQVPYSETIAETLEDPSINNPEMQSALYGQKDHVRIYLLRDYIQRIKEAGFNVAIAGNDELNRYKKFAVQPGEKFLKISKPQ